MQDSAYGTVAYPQEHDGFLHSRETKKQQTPWGKIAVGAAIGLAGLGYCASLQSTMSAQQQLLLKMQQQLDAMHTSMQAKDVAAAVVTNSAMSHRGQLPHKFAVEHVTPLKTQDNRGTCWDFAAVGVLENSYRAQGVHHGWLKENEYIPISEQAYGAEVLRLCWGPPGSPQRAACLLPGNSIWKNSTEGGESAELYYLVNGLKDSIFPESICPYDPNEGNDTVCDGLTKEKRASNPLRLAVKNMETFYQEPQIKDALLRHRQAMAFTTPMPYITHYYPCVGDFAKDERCNPESNACTLCPPELALTTCCIPVTGGENYNMHGEFIAHSGMTLEGGHVMTLVGYNDLYRTKDGLTGGYIIKNSWWDGIHPALGPKHARGSHSIKYWLQEISDWEERTMCPNSYRPDNWYQCGQDGEVIHARSNSGARVPLPLTRRENVTGIEECLSEETKLYAETNIQPLHLECTDEAYCKTGAEYTYFARNATEWGDRMQVMCFLEYNTASKVASELCLPPMLMEKIAYIFSPVADEVRENDHDVCGFYFYPYEVQQQYNSNFGNFYVNHFDIEWHASSYLANKEDYPEYDYSEVEKSTKKQKTYGPFVGPFPFARVVPSDAWKQEL
ncbi:hypothetical protein Poli38472_012676 [Pythium oligandrum]|uniref:Uncharacterized protein n=1 Tax=Pythium oligandrum TaxID=41045 RepID=A0A8K1FFC1_PYTOL|nr:hypothetical protein Poli38472_012676 [Pythium oligandrum]|eukprot:TMW61485.1 hypothetical protein Poli38472_012676 [Pythium oligandrum]